MKYATYANFFIVFFSINLHAEMFEIPGTNISIDKPEGFRLSEAGSSLVDETNELMINIGVVAVSKKLDINVDKTVFHGLKDVDIKGLSGKIGYRTRQEHGGGFDGYSLAVKGNRDGQVFIVNALAQSTGKYSKNKMQTLKNALLSITVNKNKINPAKATGISFNVEGFKQAADVSSIALIDANGSKILVTPMYLPPATEAKAIERCMSIVKKIKNKPKISPNLMNLKAKFFKKESKDGSYFCEIQNDIFYQASVVISKSVIQVLLIPKGKTTVDTQKIRQAIKNMSLLRK